MKRRSLEKTFCKILLLAIPIGCGQPTTTVLAPQPRCDSKVFVATSRAGDGGTSDAGTSGDMATGGGGSVDGGTLNSGFLSDSECAKLCGDTVICQAATGPDGSPGVSCITQCYAVGCGRHPAELPPYHSDTTNVLGRYFEQAAYLEAASVTAFQRLAAELLAHGAPHHLVASALRAAADEVRHTKIMTRLAQHYGGNPTKPPPGPLEVRPLLQLALENAQEGCVNETYGALIATLQSQAACDAKVRRALRLIAKEETQHSELAFAVARFCQSRLSATEQRQVAMAQQQAVLKLQTAVAQSPPGLLIQAVGLPTAEAASRILAEAKHALWQVSA